MSIGECLLKSFGTMDLVNLILRSCEEVLAYPSEYDGYVADLYCTARVLKHYADMDLKKISDNIYDPSDPIVQTYVAEKAHFDHLIWEL